MMDSITYLLDQSHDDIQVLLFKGEAQVLRPAGIASCCNVHNAPSMPDKSNVFMPKQLTICIHLLCLAANSVDATDATR